MLHLSKRRTHAGVASAGVIVLLLLSTGSAAAATGPGGNLSFSQMEKSADASSNGCTSNGDGTTTCA